ncbi:MAG TPA: MerR family transcriptional regulator [Polyangiales bacterium]
MTRASKTVAPKRAPTKKQASTPRVAEPFSIEELARRSGVTVRNLREFQTRGLLAPPELRGRKGMYSEAHLGRVALIRKLQERGYSLAGIGDLLEGWEQGIGIGDVLGLERSLLTPAVSVQKAMPREQLLTALPELRDPELLAHARKVGLVQGEGPSLCAPDRELVTIAQQFLAIGYPLAALLEELAQMRADAARIAERSRAMFMRYYVEPLQAEGLPGARLAELSAKIRELRPAAARAFMLVLGEAIERGARDTE